MPILNGMEILERNLGKKEKEKNKNEIDLITRNASRLLNLAESILQVTKIESGKFRINIQKDVDIHSLILQVIGDIEKKYMYSHKAKKVSIKFLPYNGKKPKEEEEDNKTDNISSNLIVPSDKKERKENENSMIYRPPLYIDCDAQKISQVIFNLLDNAVKFTTEGQIAVYTTTTTTTISQTDIHPHQNNNTENSNDGDNVISNKIRY